MKRQAIAGWLRVCLGEIETDRSASALIGSLRDRNPGVRSKAAESLGLIGTDAAVDALIAELTDPNSYIRPDAAAALGRTKSTRAVEYLTAALKDNSEAVQRQAAAALKARKNPDAAPNRPNRLDRDGTPPMWMFLKSAPTYGADERPVNELINALSNLDAAERERAARSLQARKDILAVKPLIRALQTDRSNKVRVAAAYALKVIGDPRAIPPMLAILRTEPKRQQESKTIITADRPTLRAVIDLLHHSDKRVVPYALEALKSMTLQDFGIDEQKRSEWVDGNVGR